MNKGGSAEFICKSSGDVEWYFMGDILPPNAVVHSNYHDHKLILNDVNLNNEGIYFCQGREKQFYDNVMDDMDDFFFEDNGHLLICDTNFESNTLKCYIMIINKLGEPHNFKTIMNISKRHY